MQAPASTRQTAQLHHHGEAATRCLQETITDRHNSLLPPVSAGSLVYRGKNRAEARPGPRHGVRGPDKLEGLAVCFFPKRKSEVVCMDSGRGGGNERAGK